MREEHIEVEGIICLAGAGGNFRVDCGNGMIVNAKLSGKMRQNRIRVVLGDEVTVAVSPYDASRGFITYRKK